MQYEKSVISVMTQENGQGEIVLIRKNRSLYVCFVE